VPRAPGPRPERSGAPADRRSLRAAHSADRAKEPRNRRTCRFQRPDEVITEQLPRRVDCLSAHGLLNSQPLLRRQDAAARPFRPCAPSSQTPRPLQPRAANPVGTQTRRIHSEPQGVTSQFTSFYAGTVAAPTRAQQRVISAGFSARRSARREPRGGIHRGCSRRDRRAERPRGHSPRRGRGRDGDAPPAAPDSWVRTASRRCRSAIRKALKQGKPRRSAVRRGSVRVTVLSG
jgi:hypothetical protein